jgi:hypothetical protein
MYGVDNRNTVCMSGLGAADQQNLMPKISTPDIHSINNMRKMDR